MVEETPIYTLFKIVLMLTVGWIPGYLFLNSAGPTKYSGQANSHFNPNSVLFKPQEYWQVVISDVSFGAAVSIMAWFIYNFGFSTYFYFYFIPYLIVNYHLVLITYL